jgi:hypothetical protein
VLSLGFAFLALVLAPNCGADLHHLEGCGRTKAIPVLSLDDGRVGKGPLTAGRVADDAEEAEGEAGQLRVVGIVTKEGPDGDGVVTTLSEAEWKREVYQKE